MLRVLAGGTDAFAGIYDPLMRNAWRRDMRVCMYMFMCVCYVFHGFVHVWHGLCCVF